MAKSAAPRTIQAIDKEISEIHGILCRRAKIVKMDAGSWQAAWDANPELHQQEKALYLERGLLQQQIAVAEYQRKYGRKKGRAA